MPADTIAPNHNHPLRTDLKHLIINESAIWSLICQHQGLQGSSEKFGTFRPSSYQARAQQYLPMKARDSEIQGFAILGWYKKELG